MLLNISCIVGLSSLTQGAQFGYGSILLYVIAMITFLIPSGLMVIELNARVPGEGGFYLWTKSAFGDLHGYVAAWCYWLSNIVWLPTVLLLVSAAILYIPGSEYVNYADDPVYNSVVCLIILWIIIFLNILGLERAKWIQNIGGVAIWLCMLLLVFSGVLYFSEYGISSSFTYESLLPDLSDFSVLPFFAAIAFAFGGLELSSIMGDEIKEPHKILPRSIIISGAAVASIYVLTTLAIIVIASDNGIEVIDGVVSAFQIAGIQVSQPWLGHVGALLVVFGTMGLFGAWMSGTARIPFVVGINNYLPAYFGKIHPRWKSPYVALWIQGMILTILFICSVLGATIKEAFLVLYDMSIILYFIPFMYMFAAWIWHHMNNSGGRGMINYFSEGNSKVIIIASMGMAVTFFALIMSCIPTKEIEHKLLFLLKVIGGALFLILTGIAFYKRGIKRSTHKTGQ